jgi:phosphoribosylformylglycinamidine cyclo-ligase
VTRKPSAYQQAGVDIDATCEALRGHQDLIRSTFTPGVMGDVGQFGGIFDLEAAGAAGQLLVASTDGVGTKVKLARQADRLSGIGEDLVNHCVNDILVQGARPLFFLDYIAADKMHAKTLEQVLGGLAVACRQNGCALLGGETAEMPGVYVAGEVDVAGTIVGAVQRDRVVDGSRIRVGDRVMVLGSSGLHTNGYSLARKILDDRGLSLGDRPDQLQGHTLADALLAVHRSYLRPVTPLLEASLLSGMAHVTGGGLPDNLPRVLPEGVAVEVFREPVPRAPIFDFLVEAGDVDEAEAWRVFNMGFGFVLFVHSENVPAVHETLQSLGEPVYMAGQVVQGDQAEVMLR